MDKNEIHGSEQIRQDGQSEHVELHESLSLEQIAQDGSGYADAARGSEISDVVPAAQVSASTESEKEDGSALDSLRDSWTTKARTLFGTLTIVGSGEYRVFLRQMTSFSTWILMKQADYNDAMSKPQEKDIVAYIKATRTGKLLGKGQVNILLRLLDGINEMTQKALQEGAYVDDMLFPKCDYREESGEFITFKAIGKQKAYLDFAMNYEGMAIDLMHTTVKPPTIKDTSLEQILGVKAKAAIIANLGVKTFALLRKQKGSALDWYDRKKYYMVDSNEKFTAMMTAFLKKCQDAVDKNQSVLLGLDTETTGLNVYDLQRTNEYADHIVAIPFSWEDDVSYLICTDMAYFTNVSEEMIYPIFDTLFDRRGSFGDHEINVEWDGVRYKFSRNNITVAGYNASFDRKAFRCHGCGVYFDEDAMIAMYDFAPGLVKGKNGLKDWTHAITGDMTLELEELYGSKHKDKFRYLQDAELAKVYGCADSDYTRVVTRTARRLLPEAARLQYKRYDMPIMNLLAIASWKGMFIDSAAVRREGADVQAELQAIMEFVYTYAYQVYRDGVSQKVAELATILGFNNSTSKDEMAKVLVDSEREKMFRFKFKPSTLQHLLFGVLNYPVISRTDKGAPKLDKYILSKLMQVKRETPSHIMTSDLVSTHDPSKVLISADMFNSLMYPLAYVLQTYAMLNKEYTSYYKPIMEHDTEGRMFYDFSMSFAATRRILSPGQTMKGSLKKLVKAPKGKLVMCFDASQIEFRLMASLAYQMKKKKLQAEHPQDWEERFNQTRIHETFNEMQKAEADYHVQTASQMTGKKRHKVSKKERKRYKTVGFGIPYGLSTYSLCDSLYGKITDDNMSKTQALMDDYCSNQKEIIDLLETTRDNAFYPTELEPHVQKWLGLEKVPIGAAYNLVGFKYSYALQNLTRKNTARIRRQVGNCIVQGGAAELFRRMILNFYVGCVKEGIAHKVDWYMVVHDELDTFIDADIDVLLLIKVIQQCCTLRYPDQIPYYVGIGFGDNWGEAKDDASELPVIMVDRLIDAYDNHGYRLPRDGKQPLYLAQLKRHYLCERIEEVLSEIVPNLGPGFVWTDNLVDKVDHEFENYIVRGYLPAFTSREVSKQAEQEGRDVTLKEQLECWQVEREQYGFGVPFTSTRFEGASTPNEGIDMAMEMSLGDADVFMMDFQSDLESDSIFDIEVSDEDVAKKQEILTELKSASSGDSEEESIELESGWFDSNALFDFQATEDMIASDQDNAETIRMFGSTAKNDEDFEINKEPTSAFDVMVSKKYMRTAVLNSGDAMYTAMVPGKIDDKIPLLINMTKSKCKPGADSLVFVGKKVKIVNGVELTEEFLEYLDKLLTGKAEF